VFALDADTAVYTVLQAMHETRNHRPSSPTPKPSSGDHLAEVLRLLFPRRRPPRPDTGAILLATPRASVITG
jgi:hypothetical protein